ncbi:MAG: DUF3467 domain-containing protein [Planctomycetota bacterium]
MSEVDPPSPNQPSEPGSRQVRIEVNDAKAENVYANAFRTNVGQGEVFLELGINRQRGDAPLGKDGEGETPVSFRFDVSHRVVMNFTTASNLAQHLSRLAAELQRAAANPPKD